MQTVLVILIVLSMALGHYEAIVKRGAMIVKLDRKILIIAALCGLFNERVFLDKYCGRYSSSGFRAQYADPRLQVQASSGAQNGQH